MGYKGKFINKIVYMLIISWSVLMLIAALVSMYRDYEYATILAKNEAVVSVKKDIAYRKWIASHGGIYVPITEKTQPNPYLSHVKNRDVNTSASQQLTLMNPAYSLSQMMKDYSDFYGTKGHITSRILMNPKNKADAWEEEALRKIELTGQPTYTKTDIDTEEYFRYIHPLKTEQSCLKCHAFQGYKVGDIRGGVSVSIPMKWYYNEALKNILLNTGIIFIVYLLGLGVILYGRKKAREIVEKKVKDYEEHIFSLVNIIEKRDSYTAGHTQRVAKYSILIAKEMGCCDDKIEDLYRACMLHDIGKISTPDSILLKPGRLNNLEYEIIKEHVVVSYELLNSVDIYKDIAEIVRHHHEQYDGGGYPQGLKGDETPILSQIMTVADAFDAMTTNRIYKARKSVQTAIKELNELASKQFNPEIVKAASVALKGVKLEHNITQLPKSKIEKERFVYFYKDQVTGIYNKAYLDFVLAYNSSNEFNMKHLCVAYLHNFSQYNTAHGWVKGDELLSKFANKLDSLNTTDLIFRIYGDDFVVLSKNEFDIESYIGELEEILDGTNVTLSYKKLNIAQEDIASTDDLEKLF